MQAIIKDKWCFKESKGAKGAVRVVKLRVLRREKMLEQRDAKLTALQGGWR
jgi:hypothetical protein